MQVAVAGVRVMKSARDVVVHVVAVGNALVTAGDAVRLPALDGCAGVRTRPIHFEPVLVEVALVGRVKVSVVEKVRVVAVAHGLVSAARAVLVFVTVVLAAGHGGLPAHRRAPGRAGQPWDNFFWMRKLSCALLTACLVAAAARGETVPGPRVAAATIAPLASLTATVAGPEWEVRTIIAPGVSPHVFEPTPRDVKRFAPARLVVTVGAGYDDWARKLVATCASAAVLHDAGRSVGVVPGDGEDHDGEIGRDPHWWLSPKRAARALAPLAEILAKLDPAGTAGYRGRAREGEAALLALDAELAALLAPVKGRPIVAAHNSWAYFAADYGFENGGAIETVPGREPSPRDIKRLLDFVRARHVQTVFAEPQFSPAAARILAADAGIRVALVDPIGGVPGRADYAATLRFDARAFRDGLGAP